MRPVYMPHNHRAKSKP
uniref:Uncharacterized protein n=1 Tax=Rhizophora mucronata TaxID=61149 RepID=A0A2P2J4B8_RHIMU